MVQSMKFFDSLTHITRDGSWFGDAKCDASLESLLREMKDADCYRACLVAIADYMDNGIILEAYRSHPDRFVPIAGMNPRVLPTVRRVEAVVEQLADEGFAGIKLHPRLNSYDPLEPKSLAAFEKAGELGLVVFLDTLFRQRGIITRNAPDIIDYLANAFPDTRILLLHSAGPSMLELFEIVRANPNLMMDFSFTMMRYAGSRLDLDMRFFFETTDQLVTIGSDFPEYTPSAIRRRFDILSQDIESYRLENIAFRNLERLFSDFPADRG